MKDEVLKLVIKDESIENIKVEIQKNIVEELISNKNSILKLKDMILYHQTIVE